jgi:hypothetical protein
MLRQAKTALVAIGFLALFGFLAFQAGVAFNNPRRDHQQIATAANQQGKSLLERFLDWKADEAIAVFTFVLAVSTIGLWNVTGRGIRNQSRETRILQRAYLSVIPRGIAPFASTESLLSCEVSLYNAGNLPAREVTWLIEKGFSTDPYLKEFPITGSFFGNNIIPPGSDMRKGAWAIKTNDFDKFIAEAVGEHRWLYVWGQVRYKDGFGEDRFTSFCHRYNLLGTKEHTVPEQNGRYHEYGNHTDEEPRA